jgi:hypothetical protein
MAHEMLDGRWWRLAIGVVKNLDCSHGTDEFVLRAFEA